VLCHACGAESQVMSAVCTYLEPTVERVDVVVPRADPHAEVANDVAMVPGVAEGELRAVGT
jgi:hypothetical protein